MLIEEGPYLPSPKIVVADHDASWPDAFAREAERIRPAFGALHVAIHHIGSTAVPGLRAKPVIDMLAVVSDVRALDAQTHGFEALGYEAMGEFGLPGRRYFRRNDSRGLRTHQVHAYGEESSHEIRRHLDFRDYLREHPETAHAYAELKQRLVDDCDGDMARYSDGKTAFIREIERRAAVWRRDARGDAPDWASVPIFGHPDPELPRIVRPSAYGLVRGTDGAILLVHTPRGVFLPGGGSERDEPATATIVRETAEETGLAITLGPWRRWAIEHVAARGERATFEKRSTFCDATIIRSIGVAIEPDHTALWVRPNEAAARLSRASQRWAMEQWLAGA